MLPLLQFAVPYNYSRSVSWQIQWPGLSPWLRAVLTDRWASQLMPSLVFVELWNVCCWWTRLSPAFSVAGLWSPSLGKCPSMARCSKWSESPSTKSISFSFHRSLVCILRAVTFPCVSHWGRKTLLVWSINPIVQRLMKNSQFGGSAQGSCACLKILQPVRSTPIKAARHAQGL